MPSSESAPCALSGASQPASCVASLATAADADRIASWLHSLSPLPALASRQRLALLQQMLERPETGPCLLLTASDQLLACVIARLIPRLDLAGLSLCVTEYWALPASHESGAIHTLFREWLSDWCRAHGVRHLLLPPALAAGAGMADPAAPQGMRLVDLAPAGKSLG